MEKKLSEKKRFSIVARAKSFNHAFRGIWIIFKTGHNLWVGLFFAFLAIFLGFLLNISHVEWLFVILSIGLVLGSEAFNTAIEIDINLTCPNYHPYARDTKDVAAGAVTIFIIMSGIIGLIIFLPKLIDIIL
jgi:diacylglycerol kinase